jgi:hypothetical protein
MAAQNKLMGRFQAYAPNGDLLGSLPHPLSWEMSIPLNDMSSLTMVYPKDSPSIEYLNEPCEVVFRIRNPDTGSYTEQAGCRFLNLRRQHDLIQRPGTVTYTMPSYGWMLKKARFTNKAFVNRDDRRVYTNATGGWALSELIEEAKLRGNIPGLLYNFSPTDDSLGTPWDIAFDAEYEYSQDAWSILDSMVAQGLVDWRILGRTLEVYNPNTELRRNFGGDLNGIILHPNADHLSEPVDRTWEDIASTMIVRGDGNLSRVVDTPLADTPWGNWEEVLMAGGVKSFGTLGTLGAAYLNAKSFSRAQITKEVIWRDGSPTPLLDYRPGDVIRARMENGNQLEPLRVHQITLSSVEPTGVAIHLTLNDRFLERQLRTERWVNRVTGNGGPGAGGGTGTNPTPIPQPDPTNQEPAVPTGLAVTSVGYFNPAGEPKARARVEFDPVFVDVDGESMAMARYSFYARPASSPEDLSLTNSVRHPLNATPGNKLVGFINNLDSGETYYFAVAAIGLGGRIGEYSAEVSQVMAWPTTGMPKPSLPILSSRLSTVKVEWDGDDSAGNPMPARFASIQVEMSLSASGPFTRVGEIFEPGSAVIVTGEDAQLNWGVGDELFFRFTAYDTAGNDSTTVSDVASIVVLGIEGPDIEANSITANEIAAGTITAEEIKAYSLTVDRLSIGETNNLIADPQLRDPDLNAFRVATSSIFPGSSSTDIVWTVESGKAVGTKGPLTTQQTARFSLMNNTILSLPLGSNNTGVNIGQLQQLTRNGSQVVGGIKARMRVEVPAAAAWPVGATLNVQLFAKFFDRDGAQISNPAIIASTVYSAPGQDAILTTTGAAGITPPTNTAAAYFYAWTQWTNVPAGNIIRLSEFSVWQESSVYIGDGMINTPLLAADSVTTTQLKADALTVKHTITGSVYQTTVPGSGVPRVVISQGANYLGQAGIRIDTPGPGDQDTNIFAADGAGTGGWTPYSFGIVGPETTRNSTGRVDLNFRTGGGMGIYKEWVSTAAQTGIYWGDTGNELLLEGTMPHGSELNDNYGVFRAIAMATVATQRNGSVTWALNNGWSYRPMVSPNAVSTTTPMYANYYTLSSSGFSWRQSADTEAIQFLCFRGSYDA